MFKGKRAQDSIGDAILYAVITFFGILILDYFVIELAVIDNLMPKLRDYIQGSAISAPVQTTILTNYTQIVFFLRLLPFVIFALVLFYLVMRVFRTEREMTYE